MVLWAHGARHGVSRTKKGMGRFSPTAAVDDGMAVVARQQGAVVAALGAYRCGDSGTKE
jgi:hypothetical protein